MSDQTADQLRRMVLAPDVHCVIGPFIMNLDGLMWLSWLSMPPGMCRQESGRTAGNAFQSSRVSCAVRPPNMQSRHLFVRVFTLCSCSQEGSSQGNLEGRCYC